MPQENIEQVGISTVIRMLADIERKLGLPPDGMNALEEQLAQLSERVNNHCEYTEKAVEVALEVVRRTDLALEHKLEGMNKFRETIIDQAKTFITEDVYSSNHRLLEVKVESLQRFMYLITGALLVVQVLIGFIDKMIP